MGGMEIELKDVGKVYEVRAERVTGVQGISLDIRPGEILGLLGPNGAGKSTLLKLLAMLAAPTSGDIWYDGASSRALPERERVQLRRRIGLLPEIPYVFSMLTGREYLGFLGEVYGLDRAEAARRIDAWVERFGLREDADAFLRTYSQGMLKKIALAAALVHDPAILLLDEPTNSLDPEMIAVLRDLLLRERAAGKTVVLSTHLLDIAEKLADRVAILHNGRLVCCESLEGAGGGAAVAGERSRLERLFFDVTR